MTKVGRVFIMLLVLWMCGIFVSSPSRGEVDWKIVKELKFDSEPLDMVPSLDGRNIFILVRGKIMVYSLLEGKIKESVSVQGSFDRLRALPNSEYLILTSSSEKALKIIQFKIIPEINISGLPYKGPKDAPVTIAVFTDYQ